MIKRLFFCLLLSSVFYSISAAASNQPDMGSSHIDDQRNDFKQARKALRAGDLKGFNQLYKRLESYPLRPYLDIWQAQKELKNNADRKILQTLLEHHDIPEAVDLRIAWIKNLAKRGQWPHVAEQLKFLPQASHKLPNISLRSAWYNGNQAQAFQLLSVQWRKGKNIHVYAIPFLLASWHKAGLPRLKDSQARIIYFAKRGKWKKVHALHSFIAKKDQRLLKLWQKITENPRLELKNIPEAMKGSVLTHAVIEDGLRRLSVLDSAAAWQALQHLQDYVTVEQKGHLQRNIALRAAKKHELQSASWLAGLDANTQNNETRAWHVRILLLQKKWAESLAAMQSMPSSQQSTSRWLYWQGHALQALNKNVAANLLFAQVAKGRGYYSFLSAKRLKLPYRMQEKTVAALSTVTLEKNQSIQRAYEWLQLHQTSKASREWYQGLKGATRQTWLQALQLSASWAWYDRTIQAAARAGVYDALALRFPVPYRQDVQNQARKTGLQDSLIWSVMRQESAFNARAVSVSGARGLMQLMPKTARYVSKKHKLAHINNQTLFLPATNIRIGSWYLSDLLKRFDNLQLAIAAYNAGPTRVKRWLKRTPFEHPELWVELIPFKETRRYVQQVTAFMVVYNWRKKQASAQQNTARDATAHDHVLQ